MLGKQVGDWTVVASAGWDKHKMRLWRCQCKCGSERIFGTSYLNSGGPNCCAQCRETSRSATDADLVSRYVGRVIKDWTVVALLEKRNKYGGRVWLCRCKCGAERNFITAALSGNGKRPATQCKGCFRREQELKNRVMSEIPNRFWDKLVHQATRRDITVNLTKQEAQDLFEQQGGQCLFTGEVLYFTQFRSHFNRYTNASLDRIDSSRPYELGNVQWVHKKINMMKGPLKDAEFVSWCQRVVSQLKSPRPLGEPGLS